MFLIARRQRKLKQIVCLWQDWHIHSTVHRWESIAWSRYDYSVTMPAFCQWFQYVISSDSGTQFKMQNPRDDVLSVPFFSQDWPRTGTNIYCTFPHGLLICPDNKSPPTHQNFKVSRSFRDSKSWLLSRATVIVPLNMVTLAMFLLYIWNFYLNYTYEVHIP